MHTGESTKFFSSVRLSFSCTSEAPRGFPEPFAVVQRVTKHYRHSMTVQLCSDYSGGYKQNVLYRAVSNTRTLKAAYISEQERALSTAEGKAM